MDRIQHFFNVAEDRCGPWIVFPLLMAMFMVPMLAVFGLIVLVFWLATDLDLYTAFCAAALTLGICAMLVPPRTHKGDR